MLRSGCRQKLFSRCCWRLTAVIKELKGLLDVRKNKTLAGKKAERARLNLHSKTLKAVAVKRGKHTIGVGGSVRAGIATTAAEATLVVKTRGGATC